MHSACSPEPHSYVEEGSASTPPQPPQNQTQVSLTPKPELEFSL